MPEDARSDEQLMEDLVDRISARLTGGGSAPGHAAMAAAVAPQVRDALREVVGDRLTGLAADLKAQSARTETLERMLAKVSDMAARPAPRPAGPSRGTVLASMTPHLHNPAALGAAMDGEFGSWFDFVSAAFNPGARADARLRWLVEAGKIGAALTGEEIHDGGALVPEEFRAELLSLMVEAGAIRERCLGIPMGSSTIKVPRIRDTDRSGGAVFGGVHTYWIEAGNTITASQPKFAQVQLTAKAHAGLTELDNTTIQDSFASLPGLIAMLFSDALKWSEEQAFMRGSGAGLPLGVLDSGSVIEVARKAGGNAVDAEDIHAMEGRFLPGSDGRGVWVIHPGLRKDIGMLNLGGVQFLQDDLSMATPRMLNGRPIIVCEHSSAPGMRGDIMLADWRYYLLGDRQAMSVASSAHVKFPSNASQIRVIQRLDGQPWLDAPLILAQGGSAHSVSPFVVLGDA